MGQGMKPGSVLNPQGWQAALPEQPPFIISHKNPRIPLGSSEEQLKWPGLLALRLGGKGTLLPPLAHPSSASRGQVVSPLPHLRSGAASFGPTVSGTASGSSPNSWPRGPGTEPLCA
jgi:hypothetical protein